MLDFQSSPPALFKVTNDILILASDNIWDKDKLDELSTHCGGDLSILNGLYPMQTLRNLCYTSRPSI